jgi:hypothetical protein
MTVPFANALFKEEPPGTFKHGHIFISAPDLASDREDPGIGYWHCDIAHQERLTWSSKVYELFGLPNGIPVERNWAVARYSELSRSALQKVRTYALDRKLGFMLDAAIKPEEADERWIRVLAYSIVARGRVVGLHGLKRAL